MKKPTVIALAGLLVVAVLLVVAGRRSAREREAAADAAARAASTPGPVAKKTGATAARGSGPAANPNPVPAPPTAAEKAALIAKIKRDYDEIRLKASADYTAAGASFPGGLNAFLKQLALLEREKRADFARVLTPRELEDLELRETTAGNLVQRLLGSAPETEEQRRAVFRLQRAFEDQFALTFDLTPRALFERESARQRTQEEIRAVLGDEAFGTWLRGEGDDFPRWVEFAGKNGLPPTAPLELWRAKNEFTRRRLELAAQKLPPEALQGAQAALAQEMEARAMQIVGPGLLQAARNDVLGWLPKR